MLELTTVKEAKTIFEWNSYVIWETGECDNPHLAEQIDEYTYIEIFELEARIKQLLNKPLRESEVNKLFELVKEHDYLTVRYTDEIAWMKVHELGAKVKKLEAKLS